jgi:hypothetical protein
MEAIATHSTPSSTAPIAAASAPIRRDDFWTLAAFGALAYMISNVLHEGLGHGGAAWLSGAHQITVTSTYMEAGMDTRWILAAGTLVNLVAGAAGWAVLQRVRSASTSLRFFVWTVTAFNLLLGTGYFLFSGIGGIGDWAVWMKGLSPLWAWRVGFALLGLVSYLIAAVLLARELVRIVGPGASEARTRRMTWIVYFAGGATACLAGVWNPLGWELVLISAAASALGGASGLMWIPSIAHRAGRGLPESGAAYEPLPSLPLVWLAAALLLAAYVWFLGPGVTLHLAGRG